MISFSLAVALVIALAGGLIRGLTGFGGALIMTPALSIFYDPRIVVPVVLVMEAFAAAPMLKAAWHIARLQVIAPICLAAFATVPLGSYLLANAEPDILRRVIAGMVIAFCVLMLAGVRYTGTPRPATSAALGSVSGVLLGATGIGGPPIILYLLAGPDPVQVTRANLTLCVTAISIAALGMYWYRGLPVLGDPAVTPWLCICFILGIMLGTALFRRMGSQRFRHFSLALMIAVAVVTLSV